MESSGRTISCQLHSIEQGAQVIVALCDMVAIPPPAEALAALAIEEARLRKALLRTEEEEGRKERCADDLLSGEALERYRRRKELP